MAGTTNNRMELFAAISGLGALKEPCNVNLFSDSNYLVQAFNDHWIENWRKKGWKTSNGTKVENLDLWFILSAQTQKHAVTFIKVKGHSDHPENNRCDELARAAIDEYKRIYTEPEDRKTRKRVCPGRKEPMNIWIAWGFSICVRITNRLTIWKPAIRLTLFWAWRCAKTCFFAIVSRQIIIC